MTGSESESGMEKMLVLKVGGNEIDDANFLHGFAQAVAGLEETPVIVHGGGKEIADLQIKFGLTPHFVDGFRVTDEASLAIAEMVLSGSVNKRIVAAFMRAGVEAIGLSGVDRGLVRVEKMQHPAGDSEPYAVTGLFAPESSYGAPQDLMYLIDYLHQANIGVILDWVPIHFPAADGTGPPQSQ